MVVVSLKVGWGPCDTRSGQPHPTLEQAAQRTQPVIPAREPESRVQVHQGIRAIPHAPSIGRAPEPGLESKESGFRLSPESRVGGVAYPFALREIEGEWTGRGWGTKRVGVQHLRFTLPRA